MIRFDRYKISKVIIRFNDDRYNQASLFLLSIFRVFQYTV